MNNFLSDGTPVQIIETTENLYKIKFFDRSIKKIGYIEKSKLCFYSPYNRQTRSTVLYSPIPVPEDCKPYIPTTGTKQDE